MVQVRFSEISSPLPPKRCHALQWKEAKESGQYKSAPGDSGEAAPAEVATIGSLMAFDGAAPELINGRLAMVGFLAALGAEVSSGEGVIMQVRPPI